MIIVSTIRFDNVHRNAECLRKAVPYTAPSPLADFDATLGVGDRLGIASAGHIRLFKKLDDETVRKGSYTFAPVFAQQSVREITLCDRTYEDVLDSASWAVFQENFRKPWGAASILATEAYRQWHTIGENHKHRVENHRFGQKNDTLPLFGQRAP